MRKGEKEKRMGKWMDNYSVMIIIKMHSDARITKTILLFFCFSVFAVFAVFLFLLFLLFFFFFLFGYGTERTQPMYDHKIITQALFTL